MKSTALSDVPVRNLIIAHFRFLCGAPIGGCSDVAVRDKINTLFRVLCRAQLEVVQTFEI